ncbi:YbaB/EbfC family nucleoid-associated protein [Kallotenue papyrolyticum]|uniref:YbaB/EbfC family nucleoid-associated protein n=1 Tax=Kallotenue papyrolyticum TaxID=1325125 RepID=UPI0004786609|nr:YbaB/EbfC family nucleoid-associated protein [Kallotenue papyrolyticum]
MDRRMLQQLQQMQSRLMKAQEELATTEVEGTAGGGAVKVVMNGHRELKGLTIAPEAVDPDDVETLQEMIVAAFNDAAKKAQELSESKLGGLTGGLNIPGLF